MKLLTFTPTNTPGVQPANASQQAPLERVSDVARTALARVPGWFTVAQARRVAELKGVTHLLVEEHGLVAGTVSRAALAAGRPGDSVARVMARSEAVISADAAVADARALMQAENVECLPVLSGGLLVGTISYADLSVSFAHAA